MPTGTGASAAFYAHAAAALLSGKSLDRHEAALTTASAAATPSDAVTTPSHAVATPFDAVSTPSHGKFRIATTAAARFAVLCAHLLDSFNTKHANDHSRCVKADNVHITEITYTTSLSCSAVALSASAPGAHMVL